MAEAVLIDFYGTVVHEDGLIIQKVIQEIINKGAIADKSEIDLYWWKTFQTAYMEAYGDVFQTQRELEYQSLEDTIQHFKSTADAKILSELMFEYWMKPSIFEESKQFIEKCPVPIYIVSNIDRTDILKAIEYHGLKTAGVFTSEDAKSYKPRRELFDMALRYTGLNAKQVIHIGDSMSSDVKGASEVGIKPIWINRNGKKVPEGIATVSNLLEVLDIEFSV